MIYPLNISEDFINGKNILITGGTGSFGNKMISVLLKNYSPNKIIIFSRDEYKQSEMMKRFRPEEHNCLRYFIGDIRDLERLKTAFKGVDIIFHAAALKQVPAMEYNPTEAIKTNIYGAENVINAAIYNKVKKIIAVSTDKAVNPVNLYGATKLCFEKLFLAANNMVGKEEICFSVMRYGNVFGSRGSVVPLFLEQSKKNVFTITHKDMTRFTITLEDAIHFVLNCAEKMIGGEIFIPKLPSYNIIQLANIISPNASLAIIGIRSGEKLHECMISNSESHRTYECNNYYVITSDTLYVTIDYKKHYKGDFIKQMEINQDYNSFDNIKILDNDLLSLLEIYKKSIN